MVFVTLEVPHWVYPGHLTGPHGNNIRMIQDHCHGVKIDYQPKQKRYESYNEHIPILKYIETLGAWEHSSLKFSQEIGGVDDNGQGTQTCYLQITAKYQPTRGTHTLHLY